MLQQYSYQREVMDSGEDFRISYPNSQTTWSKLLLGKHNVRSFSYANWKSSHLPQQRLSAFIHVGLHRERGSINYTLNAESQLFLIEFIVTQRKESELFALLPVVFTKLGFHVKILCLCLFSMLWFRFSFDNPNSSLFYLSCKADRSINCVRKSHH